MPRVQTGLYTCQVYLLRFCWQYSPILNKLVVYPTSGCQVSDSSFDIVLMVQRLTTVLVCCNDSELSREVQLIPSADASLASFLPVLHQRLCARECHSATLQECVQGATGRCRNSGDDSKSLSFTHELCVFKTTEKLQPNRAASLLPCMTRTGSRNCIKRHVLHLSLISFGNIWF